MAPKTQNQVPIPATISEAAKTMLHGWSIEGRNAGANLPKHNAPIAEWEERQHAFKIEAEKPIAQLLELYQPQVETIFLDGIRAIDIKPKNYQESDKVIIYIHGGAFVFYPADVTLLSSIPLADVSNLRIIAIDYTLAPQAKFHQIIDEVITAYKALLKTYKAEHIAVYGDSAGGTITVGAILKMRDLKINLPSAVVLWSAWLDLNEIGDSYQTLKDTDPTLIYKGFLENCAEAYASRKEWENPYVSPVYGDYSKAFPPTLIQVGSKEIFLSNSLRMYRQLKENNKDVELDVYEGMWHVWQGHYDIPESKIAIKNTKNFIYKHLGIIK
ncbi:alpha/beta hydrolase [Winogradskyella thalassocola]|uniref:Acetyl esterase/lipase n=1 Tax=Winogradskyella thalassocola TaxID=262004 RepID=A0A1G7X1U4_9FLAO|nr:alpha/beta hydrolase [Winogradskyella thalassocola]SDG78158.1 Acetyl esterase/lipase [Winogradskyella thalassocola]